MPVASYEVSRVWTAVIFLELKVTLLCGGRPSVGVRADDLPKRRTIILFHFHKGQQYKSFEDGLD